MIKRLKSLPPALVVEWSFALVVFASVVHTAWFVYVYSYLPSPYFWEPGDVYADWFNTAYWARNEGTYDVWATLYPPLSFVLLQWMGIDECYPRTRAIESSPGLAVRDCDWLGLGWIWMLWFICAFLAHKVLRKVDKPTAIPRTICFGLGWPLLDAVERGNLMLIALPCFMLATLPLLKSARLRWLFFGMAINLKVYRIAPLLAQLFQRRWRWVEGALLATVLVYLLSFAYLQRGTPMEIYQNIVDWNNVPVSSPLSLWPATSLQPMRSLIESPIVDFPILMLLGSRALEWAVVVLAVALHSTQGLLLLAMAAAWLRPECVTRYRLYALGALFALITSEAGGYTPVIFTIMVLLEKFKGVGKITAISLCYLLAVSYDIPLDLIAELERETYWRDKTVLVNFNLTVWPLLRPFVILAIAVALSCTTIRDVWRDVREQGWAARWRYREDAPMLPFVQKPSPPVGN